tara:strand:+ start:979 stop:1518 length:540 start_codon:yes stop_codon:yes gene_type:complete
MISRANGLRIRDISPSDLEAILEIDEKVFTETWSRNFFLKQLEFPDIYIARVAVSDNEVVGHAGLTVVVDEGHITTVAIEPNQQGVGIGSYLLADLCRIAISRGLLALTLEVRISNYPARKLYQRFGFVPAGFRRNYYSDTNEDALIMWVHDLNDVTFRKRINGLVVENLEVGEGIGNG